MSVSIRPAEDTGHKRPFLLAIKISLTRGRDAARESPQEDQGVGERGEWRGRREVMPAPGGKGPEPKGGHGATSSAPAR